MKKVLSIILALTLLMMLMAMAACGGETEDADTPTAGTPTDQVTDTPSDDLEEEVDLSQTKPNEYVKEKLEAGIEVAVAFSCNTNGNFTMNIMGGNIGTAIEAEGFTYLISNGDGDATVQLSQVENYVEMGVAAIINMPADPLVFADVAASAFENGTYMVFAQTAISFDGISAVTDTVGVGEMGANMLINWAEQNYPDAGEAELHAATFANINMTDTKLMYEAAMDTLEADPRFVVSYTNTGSYTLEDGFNGAEEALTMDPAIRFFWTQAIAGATGANNYITSRNDLDLSEFCIITNSQDDTLADSLEAAANGTGCLRGTVLSGTTPFDTTVEVTLKALYEGITIPYTAYDVLNPSTSAEWTYTGN